ncbi:unnamed protein product [Coffea canephora]|uniref:Uncharacterized protein n=1 Tax=Coffea canephora TaxID=49390 RepID=A0A068U7P0_COFCA|nr:unnamed protein product [Coffea canephora]
MPTSLLHSSSPASLNKGSEAFMDKCSPPLFSPSSDKCFWSTLRSRIDVLLESRIPTDDSSSPPPTQMNAGAVEREKRMKEDSMLLLRGFDSVAYSLSQLSDNLENALQGARDLAKPPTLTEILNCTLERAKYEQQLPQKKEDERGEETEGESNEEGKRGHKRKFDTQGYSDQDQEDVSLKGKMKSSKEMGNLNKAKNLAISMATKAGALARELKSIKSDLCFMQERCTLLEEENRRLRDGYSKGIRPEEDDLVRLQLEALLAEKSRLANENANLARENRCLHQLVEYHQLTTQDLSASYENLIRGMSLDFSSPNSVREADEEEEEEEEGRGVDGTEASIETPRPNILGFSKSLDAYCDEP